MCTLRPKEHGGLESTQYSRRKTKRNGDLKKIFFKRGTIDHLNSDSYQTVPENMKIQI